MAASAIRWRAGFFGPRTREAISKFQVANGIQTENRGVYDQVTADALTTLDSVTSATFLRKPQAATRQEKAFLQGPGARFVRENYPDR
jgi:peptidoglycan hydrolase-like protein with peptidoglycan-binding domain